MSSSPTSSTSSTSSRTQRIYTPTDYTSEAQALFDQDLAQFHFAVAQLQLEESDSESVSSTDPDTTQVHIQEDDPTLVNPVPADSSRNNLHVLGPLPLDWFGLGFLYPTQAPDTQPLSPLPIMSKSLRAGNQPSAIAPNTKHTKNVQANHELDSIQVIWDTLQDTTDSYTDIQRRRDIEKHLRERAATLQIGSTVGWRAVPGSELQKSFQTMGLSEETAQTLASTTYKSSFRGSSRPSSAPRGRGRGRGKKASA